MAAGGSFDQWQKDAFFTAAEEVQESADTLESFYRMWMRNHKVRFDSEASDELQRELQTALGTAKWQLEDFEKAVQMNHRSLSSEDTAVIRHKQFLSVIGNQIMRIEKGLNGSLIEEGKQPLRWVQLDKQERDDLADFLSGVPSDRRQAKHVDRYCYDSPWSYDSECMLNKRDAFEVVNKESYERKATEVEQSRGQMNPLSSSEAGDWKIVIADEETENRPVETRSEGLTHISDKIWKFKNRRHGLSYYLKGVTRFIQCLFDERVNGMNARIRNCSNVSTSQHLIGKVGAFRRRTDGTRQQMHLLRYLWMTCLLLLSIVLVIPFVLYSA
ncbi:hypothetical protein ZIOFF_011995 [Zingiber officinale]|uniref:Syntaxin 6/10/61 N-terminal domain-containing protein n=1 Tax=Zingiber officinale TaxID=94328 RepID=A0A8J5HNR2_ZINOF|nr:hypothetical protein ZIOFF_011995 [Zingiber officinale]